MTKTMYFTLQCKVEKHSPYVRKKCAQYILEETANLFNALDELSRLRLMEILVDGPQCVSELALETGQSMSIISQRLKILHQA